jgi:hypothetical protein
MAGAIVDQCREARFLYIKQNLSPGMNLEVNQDKIRVSKYLDQFGFSADLVSSLNEADSLYSTAASELTT